MAAPWLGGRAGDEPRAGPPHLDPAPSRGNRALRGGVLGGALNRVFFARERPATGHLARGLPANIITQVFRADGSVLGELRSRTGGWSSSGTSPRPAQRRVAVEDEDFWKHIGIDRLEHPRAALANIRSGRRRQGFSTLTMQLTRLLFLTPEKTYERKSIRRSSSAFQIEKNFTKEEIFTLYCQTDLTSATATYGVEAASRFFFSKSRGRTFPWPRPPRRRSGPERAPLSPVHYPSGRSPGAITSSSAWRSRST